MLFWRWKHKKVHGAYCLGIFQNGKDPSTLLGGIIARNTLITYDREQSKIGFWKTNCSQLWEKLKGPPHDETNLTTEAPPVSGLAPNKAPHYVFPDGFKIGQIAFDMSLNISYADLKPHMTMLVEYVAHGLEISTSQVHLLKATPDGNNSLTKWTVSPAGSADYISNGTAARIISQLAAHDMQLPRTFGHYELVGWNVQSKEKRSGWQQIPVVVIFAIFVVLAIVVSAFGVVVICRHRQQTTNAYKLVNVAIPEQELQPL